jgi:hypothetical protein
MAEEITRVRFLQDIAETVVFRDVIKRYDLHTLTSRHFITQTA